MNSYKKYIKMARPDHWVKNIFLFPGVAVALMEIGFQKNAVLIPLFFGFVATSLVASANYVINEVLDAEFDKHHPIKKYRPAVTQDISLKIAYSEYGVLLLAGVTIGYLFINAMFTITLIILALCGIFYNVKPFRLKDRTYLDVVFESFNNVLRLMLGWFIITNTYIPPLSLVISFWSAGAFLMAVKRYAEYREIGDPEIAGLYRRSFKFYNEEKLLITSFFYSLNFAFFFGLFLYKYRFEYILLFPLFAGIFTWYLKIAMHAHSAAQNPHKLFSEKRLMLMLFIVIIGLWALTFIDIPWIEVLITTYQSR